MFSEIASKLTTLLLVPVITLAFIGTPRQLKAETNQESPYSSDVDADEQPPEEAPAEKPKKKLRTKRSTRKYFVPDTERSDAGVFHVAFAAGGNFYVEPKLDATTKLATGDYFKDFGFQGGVIFDYDYSAMSENIPLALRGMVGYKYILSSVHVFAFDVMTRYILRVSDKSTFGFGPGVSAALWYRAVTSTSLNEETLFLPSLILEGGFDFNPFMVDFKWLINRIGADNSIMGWELYFGVRL